MSDVFLAAWEGILGVIAVNGAPEQRCRAVCREVARSLGFPRALLSTVDRECGQLVVRGAYDPSVTGPLYRVLTNLWAASLEPDGEGRLSVAAWCVEKKEQVHVPDSSRYAFRPDATYQRNRVVRALGVRGYVLTPIVAGDEALGLLGVDCRESGREVTAEELRVLRLVAGLLAVALPGLLREPDAAVEAATTEAVAEAGSQMQALLDVLDQGVLVIGVDGRVRYLNRAATRLLDVIPWEGVGRPWQEILVLRQAEAFAALLGQANEREPRSRRRWTIVQPGGRLIDVELKLLKLSSTVMSGAQVVVMEDVSHRAELQRLRDEFTSMLVHDLKAPLQSIVGFAELLRTERLGSMNEDQKEFVLRIEESGEQMMGLVGDILEVARYETGRSLMRKERVPPSPLVQACVQKLQGKALPAGVRIHDSVPADLPDLFADPLRLTQILQNLIANAIHVSPPGGVVSVRTERVREGGQPWVRFEVEDHGPGLTAEEAVHLFDKFWTGSRAQGNHVAHGLGLVIARLIVEGHRGTISALSHPEGGTVVGFTIPVFRPDR